LSTKEGDVLRRLNEGKIVVIVKAGGFVGKSGRDEEKETRPGWKGRVDFIALGLYTQHFPFLAVGTTATSKWWSQLPEWEIVTLMGRPKGSVRKATARERSTYVLAIEK